MSLRSSSQQPPGIMSNAIGSSRESNPSRTNCNLRLAPLDHGLKHLEYEGFKCIILKYSNLRVGNIAGVLPPL